LHLYYTYIYTVYIVQTIYTYIRIWQPQVLVVEIVVVVPIVVVVSVVVAVSIVVVALVVIVVSVEVVCRVSLELWARELEIVASHFGLCVSQTCMCIGKKWSELDFEMVRVERIKGGMQMHEIGTEFTSQDSFSLH
jgi:hypothetical protein